MPQAHRHHQLLWSSPLLFYWRTLLSQLQAVWAASPCPGLCSSPRKIKKPIKCLWSACRLLHSDLSFSMHQLKPCSPWPHSVSVSNIKLVRMKEKYPAWPSRVAFVQRKSGNCKLNFSCNLEAVFSPYSIQKIQWHLVKRSPIFTCFSKGESSWLHFQDYLLSNDFRSVLFTCRTSWYFWTEQRTLLHVLSV